MKLYAGKKRLAMRMLPALHRRLIEWALTIKPGQYIGTCDGCNRKVAKIDFVEWRNEGLWRRSRPNKTWFVAEVTFEDTHGYLHHCPGGGCAYPAETPEEVTRYFREWAFAKESEEFLAHWYVGQRDKIEAGLAKLRRFQDALRTGAPIVDEHGELLPEFDKHESAGQQQHLEILNL